MINKVKVAIVIGRAVNGGTESLWFNYCNNMKNTNYEFDFLIESESKILNYKDVKEIGCNIVIIPSYKNIFKYVSELKKIFKKNNYDIVHSNMSTLSVFTLKAAYEAKVPIRIAHSHSTSNKKEILRNCLKNLLRLFSKKYSNSYFTCSELAGRYLFGNRTFDDGNVYLMNNAIDLNLYSFSNIKRNEIRNKYNIAEDTIIIGNIGRMSSQKNQIFLIDIFEEYHKTNKNSKLMIVGDGPLMDKINYKIKKKNLSDDVLLLGSFSNTASLYSCFDILCMPSLYEGLPVVGIEAQANGLPVLFSENITSEVKCNGNVDFASLKCDAKFWSEKVDNLLSIGRTNNIKLFIYDIKEQSKLLINKYDELLCLKENNQ